MLRCTGPAGDETAYLMAAAAVVRRDLPGGPPSRGGATSWDQRAKEPNSFTWEVMQAYKQGVDRGGGGGTWASTPTASCLNHRVTV